jgi:phosphopantothenoylcysteine decarboxylase/phosphopantothenate--cysteine ligase
MRLEGKTVLLGVSGGIACYKACELVRLLVGRGARVQVVMTAGAQQFVTPLTLQTLSGQPVATDTFSLTQESEIGHIRLADSSDVVVIAPATANVIGKLANGIGDDLLTTILLATRAPLLIAPAMNVHMWDHAAVQENLARLTARGARVVGPASGSLACGYEGAGRLAYQRPSPRCCALARICRRASVSYRQVQHRRGPRALPVDRRANGIRDRAVRTAGPT